MIGAKAPQPDLESLLRELDHLRGRDPLRAARVSEVIAILEQIEVLKKRAAEVLETLRPSDGSTRRSWRREAPWRSL